MARRLRSVRPPEDRVRLHPLRAVAGFFYGTLVFRALRMGRTLCRSILPH